MYFLKSFCLPRVSEMPNTLNLSPLTVSTNTSSGESWEISSPRSLPKSDWSSSLLTLSRFWKWQKRFRKKTKIRYYSNDTTSIRKPYSGNISRLFSQNIRCALAYQNDFLFRSILDFAKTSSFAYKKLISLTKIKIDFHVPKLYFCVIPFKLIF